jgi:type II secretory pathway predicted ATPase ExeA
LRANSGYKYAQVSDPPSKSWPEDDPSFLASLDDLDRGLDGNRPEPAPVPTPQPPPPTTPPRAPRSAPAPPHPPPASNAPAPLVPPGTFGDPDDPPPPLTFRQPEPGDPRAQRPLLELFPVPDERGAAPAQRSGSAVGPPLPPRTHSTARPESAARSRDGLTFEAFYGLRERPFTLSTDPKFQYQSAAHGRASREVLAAIGNRTGPVVLTGPLGMGKTMLCRALVHEIDRRTVTSLVLEPLQSLDDLLKTMLVDFGVVARQALAGAAHPSRELMTGTLQAFLESLVPLQGSAVVFIDEAQNVPPSVLGALDTLCPGDPGTRVLQFVLVGQPALTSLLDSPELRALDASIARRAELGPLGADEVAPYVAHRLAIAGGRTRIAFDEAATARLFELSDGSPRTVNLICDRAMTRGHTTSADVIGEELIHAAAVDLDLEAPADAGSSVLRTALLAVAFVLLMLAGAAGALWLWRDAVNRAILQWEQAPVPSAEPVRSLPAPIAPIPPPDDAPGGAPGSEKPPDARR